MNDKDNLTNDDSDVESSMLEDTKNLLDTHGYTRCRYCIRVVRVESGVITHHVSFPGQDSGTCEKAGSIATWVVDTKLKARSRNAGGFCMKCWQNVDTGPNDDCSQCGE